jgi:hypothetical protein
MTLIAPVEDEVEDGSLRLAFAVALVEADHTVVTGAVDAPLVPGDGRRPSLCRTLPAGC